MARRNRDRGQRCSRRARVRMRIGTRARPARARGSTSASPRRDIIVLRAPAREAPPATERPAEPAEKTERPSKPGEKEAEPGQKPDAEEEKSSEKPRRGWLRRHPFLAAVGLVALLLAAAAGYLYWDHTSHFESTDDAFIAARQFAIAPKVAGYVTAVPVTDNQHVNKGGMVAQIDQRDYRVALAQAEAQVSGGGSRHPQHRHADRYARRADRCRSGAGEPGTSEPGTHEGHLGTRQAARQSGLGDGSAGHGRRPDISRPSRPLSTARKRRSKWRSGKSTR